MTRPSVSANVHELSEIRRELVATMRLSGEGSYARRQPKKKFVPQFIAIVARLHSFLHTNTENAPAWDLLSLTEECLLNYHESARCLQRALDLCGQMSNRDRKRLARLKEYQRFWEVVPLSPEELKKLGCFLREQERISEEFTTNDLRITTEWLEQHKACESKYVINKLKRMGFTSDFSVLYNLVNG